MTGLRAEVVDRVLALLCDQARLGVVSREPIRVWRLSGVERLRPSGHPAGEPATVVFKYATGPGVGEDEVLRWLGGRGVPVPRLYASVVVDATLGMLMEDLGDPRRPAEDSDAARAAAHLHRLGSLTGLDTWDNVAMRTSPAVSLAQLERLRAGGRFPDGADLLDLLGALDQVSTRRAEGTDIPPYGLCHSELHPTSLHIGHNGWRLLDVANAFNGPGLLDLATWFGTRHPPDPPRLRRLIQTYAAMGGRPEALAARGGLPAECWALAWHRVWSAGWFIRHAADGTHPPATDAGHTLIIRRQLGAALQLLADED